MKKYVFVSVEGFPVYTAMPAVSDDYISGTQYGSLLCLEVPFNVPDTEILNTWYWKDGTQKGREPQPTPNSSWDMASENWIDIVEEPTEWNDEVPIIVRPPRPAPYYVWSDGQWVPDIMLAKEIATASWDDWRDLEMSKGYNGFHSDQTFLIELTLLSMGFSKGLFDTPQQIRKMDNTTVLLGAEAVDTLLVEIGTARQAIYHASWVAKDAINASTDIATTLLLGPPNDTP